MGRGNLTRPCLVTFLVLKTHTLLAEPRPTNSPAPHVLAGNTHLPHICVQSPRLSLNHDLRTIDEKTACQLPRAPRPGS